MSRYIMDTLFERTVDTKHKVDMQHRWNCFYDESESYVKRLIIERNPLTHSGILTIPMDYYPAVISKLAGDLDIPELRFDGNEAGAAVLKEVLQACRLSETLQSVGLMMELVRTVGVQVSWDEKLGRVRLTPTPPMNFDVHFPQPSANFHNADGLILYSEGFKVVWTATDWEKRATDATYTDDSVSGPNLYGVLPFSVFQVTDVGDEFWKSGGHNLYTLCLALSYHWSDLMYTAEFQSHAMPVFTGMSPEDARAKVISPSHGIGLTEQQTFEFVAPPDASAPRRQLIRSAEESLSYLYDLPSETFDKTLAPASGVAREIAYAGLMQRRTKLAKRLAWQAIDLIEKIKVVHNTHSPEVNRVDNSVRLSVVEADWVQRVRQDPNERAINHRERIAMNLISPVDVIMEERGVDRVEAVRIYEENKRLNAAPVTAATAKAALGALGT